MHRHQPVSAVVIGLTEIGLTKKIYLARVELTNGNSCKLSFTASTCQMTLSLLRCHTLSSEHQLLGLQWKSDNIVSNLRHRSVSCSYAWCTRPSTDIADWTCLSGGAYTSTADYKSLENRGTVKNASQVKPDPKANVSIRTSIDVLIQIHTADMHILESKWALCTVVAVQHYLLNTCCAVRLQRFSHDLVFSKISSPVIPLAETGQSCV